MNNLTFAQLCAEFVAANEEIERLSGLHYAYRTDEYDYVIEEQKKRRAEIRDEMQRRLGGGQ